jgi:hypothetical protein
VSEQATTRPDLLLRAATRLIEPLARLLVRNGVTYTMFAQALKRVFLAAAERELQADGKRVTDSALSLLSGVHRKDVRALTGEEPPVRRTVTIASQVTMAWTTQPEYMDGEGRPRALPMRANGDEPSFERLSQGISKDFHARSVLDELTRLGVIIEREGLIRLVLDEGFLPARDMDELARHLAANVADHLAAAAANFTAASRLQPTASARAPYLEYALWGDELSAASVAELQQLAQKQWLAAMKQVRNTAEKRSDVDRTAAAAEGGLHRFRFGVYFYHQPGFEPLAAPPPDTRGTEAAPKLQPGSSE